MSSRVLPRVMTDRAGMPVAVTGRGEASPDSFGTPRREGARAGHPVRGPLPLASALPGRRQPGLGHILISSYAWAPDNHLPRLGGAGVPAALVRVQRALLDAGPVARKEGDLRHV